MLLEIQKFPALHLETSYLETLASECPEMLKRLSVHSTRGDCGVWPGGDPPSTLTFLSSHLPRCYISSSAPQAATLGLNLIRRKSRGWHLCSSPSVPASTIRMSRTKAPGDRVP